MRNDNIKADSRRALHARLNTEREAFDAEQDATAVAEYARQLRAEIEQDKKYIDNARLTHNDFDATLADREANIEDNARGLVESDKARAQHLVNVSLADRLQRSNVSDQFTSPAEDDVLAALAYFGATTDIYRHTAASMERDATSVALVRLYREATETAEKAADRITQEAAIKRMTDEYRMAQYAEQLAAERLMEG